MNAKHLRDLIEQGHRVAVKANKKNLGLRVVFLYIDGDGYFQGTSPQKSLDYSLRRGLCDFKQSPEQIESDTTNEYKVVTPAPLMLEVGDSVEVIDSYVEKKGFVPKLAKFIIEKVYGYGYELSFKNKPIGYGNIILPYRAVVKVEEETEEDILIKDGKKYRLLEIKE